MMQEIVNIFNQSHFQNYDLQLTHAGFSVNLADHTYGPTIRNEYLIHIVLKGHGTFQTTTQQWQLGPSDGFLTPPNMPIAYHAAHQQPWQYLFFGFDGKLAAKYLHQIGIDKDRLVFHLQRPTYFKKLIQKCLSFQHKGLADEFMMQSIIYELLSGLARYHQPLIKAPTTTILHDSTKQALAYLGQHFKEPININQLCQAIGFERVYLSKLFKTDTGLTPYNYLNHLRVEYAVDLLSMTKMSVEEIAHEIGFKNVDVFIRSFKKIFHITPKQFQKRETRSQSVTNAQSQTASEQFNFQLRV
ncbi:AraC family transcriptional regulator [Bombilactobacillus folatiphilus]|uniref:AraC family transcriptional regulator n=1 Tax=Bombilactobacillus folatiphilus TaxID=2923362 RepID=A0ABY4P8S6_9LACO|nr:AraC family transcriptional regulator [Bombilactobacillus folatiphilus]UQS82001.1 AraC family transcriptional regulator [Bombilactobacillus folatiphilus]